MPRGALNAVTRHLRHLAGASADVPTDAELLRRFVSDRDETAFAGLVERHGRLVWSVCRRTLRHPEDAEDAFQATFLVLARKAESIRKAASVASWLYGVAYRTAMRAKQSAARQRHEERRSPTRAPEQPVTEAALHELQALLDEEVQRLPEKVRAPFVLCCLEGRSRAEAARELGWKEGTVAGRVAQARERLRQRLARRGVVLAAALCATEVGRGTASALPTVVAAAAREVARGAASARAAALARGVIRAMFATQLKGGAALLLALGLLAAGTAAVARQALAAPRAAAQKAEGAHLPAAEPEQARGEGRPAPTDRYGDPLPKGAVARLGTVRFRPNSGPGRLAFTPDGRLLISAGWDNVSVCEAATGQEIWHAHDPSLFTYHPAFSPDGRLIAAAGAPLRLWETATGKLVREIPVSRVYRAVRFAPDSKTLAALGDDGTLDFWDVATGRRLGGWVRAAPSSSWIRFAPDGKRLVTGGDDRAVHVWDAATGRKVRELAGAGSGWLVALSPDGSRLASVGMRRLQEQNGARIEDDRVHVWDLAGGKEVWQAAPPRPANHLAAPPGLLSLAWSPDGKALAAAGAYEDVWLWEAATGKELRHLPLGGRGGMGLAFGPDGKSLAAQVGGAIRLFDLPDGRERGIPAEHRFAVSALALTPDGRTLATAGNRGEAGFGDHTVVLWDPATGQVRCRLEGHAGDIAGLALGADGRTLWSLGCDNTVRLWDLATGRELRRWAVGREKLVHLTRPALSPDGRCLAVVLAGGEVQLLDPATGHHITKLSPKERQAVFDMTFTPDGHTLVVSSTDSHAHLWDVATGKEVGQVPFYADNVTGQRTLYGTGMHYCTALSPDGRLLAFGSQSHYLALYDLATRREVRRIDGLTQRVRSLAFSPDGRTLAWGGYVDGVIHLLELATGQERCRLAGHRGDVTALTFSADGRRLISGGADTTALVWDLTGRVGAGAGWTKPLPPGDLGSLWDDLTGGDAARAFRAAQRLAASPAQAVPFLAERVRPVRRADGKRLAALIADLDSDQFRVRDRASAQLEQLGEAASGACRKALEQRPSAEVRRRLEEFLDRQGKQPCRLARVLETLERIDTPEARQLLAHLARGVPGAYLTQEAKASLVRLSRRPTPSP